MIARRGMTALLALILGLAAASSAVAADPGVLVPVDEDEILILEVRVDRYLASNGVIGYRHGDRILLPLGELAEVLEYAILAYPERGVVDGWLVDEDRAFRLDVNSRSVVVDGRQTGIDEPCVYINDDDIYVDSEVLTRWWPIELDIDLTGLRVLIAASEAIPLLNRLNREAMWARLDKTEASDEQFPRRDAGYRMASWPFLDATVSVDTDRDDTTWRGSLLSRGDLARLSTTGFLGYDRSATSEWTAWLRAGRTDRDGGLFGPLRATAFSAGDVTGIPLPMIGNTPLGRGFSITNQPPGSIARFDVVDVNGDAPPGWEVELYLDGTLHDIQTAGDDGGFFFAAVPLHLGLNTIRAVLYGPNGQKREQVRTYNIRSGMWKRGHLHYNYSVLQSGKSIIGSRTTGSSVRDEGDWTQQLDVGYGLSTTTTLGAAYARSTVGESPHDYVQMRLLQSAGPVFLQAVGIKDLDEGGAGKLSAQSRWRRQSLYFGFAKYSDFTSNTSEGDGVLSRETEARVSGALLRRAGSGLSYRLKWQGQDYIDDIDLRRDYLNLYLGKTMGSFSLAHNLQHLAISGASSRDETLGKLLVAGNLAGARVRGELDYDIGGADGLRGLAVTASRRFRVDLSGQIVGRRSFLGAGADYLMGNMDWHLRTVRLGLKAGYATGDGMSVGVSATTSLARAPASGGWLVSGRKLSTQGAAMVQAFLDENNDGRFGGDEKPLGGIGFGRNQLWRDIRTAEDGKAFLPGLPANRFVNVKVDYRTVEDPYLVPVHDGMTTVVHAGGVSDLSFPFHYVGEIEGVVARDEALSRPLRNIGLELVDMQGERVATAVSEFDGFYLFQDIVPGNYRVGVVESTLRGRPFIIPPRQPVTVPPGGDYVPGPDIVLKSRDDAPVVVVVETPEPEPEPAPVREMPEASGDGGDRVVAMGGAPAAGPAIEPRPTTPAVETPASRVAIETGPSVTPEAARTLHLIYELLYDSTLFTDGAR